MSSLINYIQKQLYSSYQCFFATYRCTLLFGAADSKLTSYAVQNRNLIPDSINDLSSAITSRTRNQNFQSPGYGLAICLTMWQLKLHAQYHWHQNPPLDAILNYMNSPLILMNSFLKIHLNVIPPAPRLNICRYIVTKDLHMKHTEQNLCPIYWIKTRNKTNFLCERTNNIKTKNNNVLFFLC